MCGYEEGASEWVKSLVVVEVFFVLVVAVVVVSAAVVPVVRYSANSNSITRMSLPAHTKRVSLDGG